MVDDDLYDLVTVKRARGGIVRREHLAGQDISVKSQFRIESGDFLISKRQIVHGACALVPKEFADSIVSNEYAVLETGDALDNRFLAYLSHTPYFQQTCFHSSIGVHIEKMIFKLDRWFRWEFNIPPLAEQKKIVDILSTWDAAIATTEKLLANAEAQKRALIQQLLTGGRRLDGFGAEWQVGRLSNVASVIVSNVDKKSVASEKSVRLCNYTDVYSNDTIRPDMTFMVATATDAQIKKFALKKDDVVITKDSETPVDIAIPAYVSKSAPDLVCGYHLAIIRPNRGISGRFLKYYFEHPITRHYFASRANGATRFGLTVSSIEEATIRYPERDEQERIADCLSTVEREIAHIQADGRHLRSEKHALLRQLLTGKRRVRL